LKVPASQGAQVAEPATEEEPAAQLLHATAPVPLKVPGTHWVQLVAPTTELAVPLAHGVHVAAPRPA